MCFLLVNALSEWIAGRLVVCMSFRRSCAPPQLQQLTTPTAATTSDSPTVSVAPSTASVAAAAGSPSLKAMRAPPGLVLQVSDPAVDTAHVPVVLLDGRGVDALPTWG